MSQDQTISIKHGINIMVYGALGALGLVAVVLGLLHAFV